MITIADRQNNNIKWCYHFPLYIFWVIIYGIIFRVLSSMLSFDVIIWCYHFSRSANVIIFPCTYFLLSFMLSFAVIIYCYHFPPFFFFLKTWHTRNLRLLDRIKKIDILICYPTCSGMVYNPSHTVIHLKVYKNEIFWLRIWILNYYFSVSYA